MTYAELRRAWEKEKLAPLEAKDKPRQRVANLAGHADVAPLYGPEDVADLDPVRDLGVPGAPPFTRGVQPNMYRGRLWTMRQYAGFGTAAESNERYHYLLKQGQTGLSVAFDLPTQMGRDSDDPQSQGEVGRVGVAILRLITDIFGFCGKDVPRWNTISISGYHIREAGCDAAQEIAFTLADGMAYVKAARDAGLDVDAFGAQLSFFFNVHNNLIEEVAKFRAARRMWSAIMKERFGAKTDRARALRFHCQTAGMTLTAQQPLNNVARVTLQALAAVLGGCQSLHTNSYDEALGLPTSESATIALRTQQIVAHESGVADFVDALGGAYAIEALTDRLEAEANKYIARIDELGGMVAAIEQGYPQREIQNSAYSYQLEIEKKQRTIVGLNDFVQDAPPVPVMKIDPQIERAQVDRLRAVRAKRDEQAYAEALRKVEAAAKGTDNLLPFILDAVKASATVGEIAGVLRRTWGEHVETLVL